MARPLTQIATTAGLSERRVIFDQRQDPDAVDESKRLVKQKVVQK
jgi:hypothetical protein